MKERLKYKTPFTNRKWGFDIEVYSVLGYKDYYGSSCSLPGLVVDMLLFYKQKIALVQPKNMDN